LLWRCVGDCNILVETPPPAIRIKLRGIDALRATAVLSIFGLLKFSAICIRTVK